MLQEKATWSKVRTVDRDFIWEKKIEVLGGAESSIFNM